MSVGRQVVKHVKNFNDAKTGSVQLHSCARWDGVTHPIRVSNNVLKRKRPLRGGPIGRALGESGHLCGVLSWVREGERACQVGAPV